MAEALVKEKPSLGYHEEKTDTVIRLVSTRKRKKEYQVTGIQDIASENNWKAWLYLAPVIILIAVFLFYPLINTIFIAFTENYRYSQGTYDGFTLNNFGIILGVTKQIKEGRRPETPPPPDDVPVVELDEL